MATLADEGIVTAADRTPRSLPKPTRERGSYVRRTASALADFLADYPAGHLIISSEKVMRDAIAILPDIPPTTMWLPAGTEPEVIGFFGKTMPNYMDLVALPDSPRARGPLPVFVTLGVLTSSMCLVPPGSYSVLRQFGQRGPSVLIDPSDPDVDEMLPWRRAWTSTFDRVYRPSLDDADPTTTEPDNRSAHDDRPGGHR